jgi:hypothetical protein
MVHSKGDIINIQFREHLINKNDANSTVQNFTIKLVLIRDVENNELY